MGYEGVLHAERFTSCPFSVAQEYAEDYLRDAERGGDRAVVSAGPLRRRVTFRFGLRSDAAERGRAHEEIVLHWFAGMRFLPNFRGTLRMRISMPGTMLVLDGRYVPPGGVLGTLFDRLVGRRIATASADSLLAAIDETLEGRERAWRDASERISN